MERYLKAGNWETEKQRDGQGKGKREDWEFDQNLQWRKEMLGKEENEKGKRIK